MLEIAEQYQRVCVFGMRQIFPGARERKLGISSRCRRQSPSVAQPLHGEGTAALQSLLVCSADNSQFYVLPEGYLVSDPSLNDILYVLNPKYRSSTLPRLSKLPPPSYTLSSQPYLPGYIGLNNIKKNDYLNVILHLLLHVPPVRTFFLDHNAPELQEQRRPTELVKRLSTLAKRLWNPRLFKSQISPHEFVQEVAKRSGGKFKMTEQGDPVEFLGWIVNTLHRDLGGTKKRNSSVIYSTFQGKVQIETQQVIIHKDQARPIFDIGRGRLPSYSTRAC